MLDFVHKANSDEPTDLFLRPKADGIDLYGKRYLCDARSRSPAGFAFVDPDAPGPVHVFTNEQLWDWHDRGDLRFVTRPDAKLPVGAQRSLRRTLATMTERERSNVLRRLRYCRAIDEAGIGLKRCDDLWQPLCDGVAKKLGDKVQHWKTHYRWWLAWASAGRDPRVLAGDERSRGRRQSRLDDIQLQSMEEGVAEWLTLKRPTYATAQHAVNAAIRKKLGKHNVDRMIERGESPLVGYKPVRAHLIRIGRSTRLYRRHGAVEARRQMAAVYRGPASDLPLDRVDADFKYVGLFVIDDDTKLPLGTPYLAGAVDYFSGAVAGFDIGFDPPGSASASRLLAHVIERKTFDGLILDDDGKPPVDGDWPVNGVPRYFNLDNDVAFHATHFRASASALGCDLNFLEPGDPHKKGMIESLWKSVAQSYLDMFPGKRLRIFDKPPHDYKPEDFAVISLKALRTFLTKAFVDVHNQTKDERSGQIRIERYREAARVDPPRPVPAHEDILEMVGCQVWRQASRKGVVIFGMHYNSDGLARYRSDFFDDPKVEVRYSPDDIGSVLVVDRPRGISIRVPCTLGDYATGLSLHQHRVVRRHALDKGVEGKLYREHLEAAKTDLFQLGRDLFAKKKNRKLRQSMAQFFGMSPETLARVTGKTADPTANKSILDKEAAQAGAGKAPPDDDKNEVLDIEPDIDNPTSDLPAEDAAKAVSLAAPDDNSVPRPHALKPVSRTDIRGASPAAAADDPGATPAAGDSDAVEPAAPAASANSVPKNPEPEPPPPPPRAPSSKNRVINMRKP